MCKALLLRISYQQQHQIQQLQHQLKEMRNMNQREVSIDIPEDYGSDHENNYKSIRKSVPKCLTTLSERQEIL